jgi:hypothetical protein
LCKGAKAAFPASFFLPREATERQQAELAHKRHTTIAVQGRFPWLGKPQVDLTGARLRRRAPKDPHGLSYYIRRAEDLLAGLTDTKESLTLDDRAMLERHQARVREIAPKPDPLMISEKQAIHTFVEIVGALGPRLQSLRNRASGDWAAEIKATVDRATAKARAGKARKHMRDILDAIAEETRPGRKRNDVLKSVNERWTALDGEAISSEALRAIQKRQKKSGRLSADHGRLLDDQ